MNFTKTETLKVLYFTYPAAFQFWGGAENLLLKTKEYAEKISRHKIKLFDMFNDRLSQYDYLHVFSMHPDGLFLSQKAKQAGLKFVLSPIHWEQPTKSTDILTPLALSKFYLNVKSYRFATFRELFPFKNFLELADIILPNSKLEADKLSQDFRISREKFWVVPNAVEQRFASADPSLFVEKYGLANFVLYVGRIEKNKNPLGLIKACTDLNIPLVIIGAPNIGDEEYFNECKKSAEPNKNIKMIGFLPHDSAELSSAYAAAKAFVLPSLFEIPGLTALEAGLAGCNVAITSRGSTREYFKDYVLYLNPASQDDIREKTREAYEKPKNDYLKQHILNNYTWERTAEKTLQAYELVLSRSR